MRVTHRKNLYSAPPVTAPAVTEDHHVKNTAVIAQVPAPVVTEAMTADRHHIKNIANMSHHTLITAATTTSDQESNPSGSAGKCPF